MDLATVFKRYAREGTGELVLKFSDTPHLCKIAIDNGEAVFIKLGTLPPQETLDFIRGKEPVEASFIKGFIPRKRLPEPITALLLQDQSGEDQQAAAMVDDLRDAGAISMSGKSVSPEKVNRLINAYIDVVGPLGVVMAENCLKKMKYTRGTTMGEDDYHFLLKQLLVDVPRELHGQFLNSCQ